MQQLSNRVSVSARLLRAAYSSTPSCLNRFEREAASMAANQPEPFRQGEAGTPPPTSRCSLGTVTATVFGGTGFLGRYVIHELGLYFVF